MGFRLAVGLGYGVGRVNELLVREDHERALTANRLNAVHVLFLVARSAVSMATVARPGRQAILAWAHGPGNQ